VPRCVSCSAPLPKSGIICEYCGTRNDIDLHDAKTFVNIRPHQERNCPICHVPLHTINVGEKVPFLIERCESCYGIFFDLHELEEMIEQSVKGSRNVDLMKLAKITEHPRHIDILVYRRCPVCNKMMQRKNFWQRSGVITDVCAEHGVWLDSGELRQILEWVKTGGIERIRQEEGEANPLSRHAGNEWTRGRGRKSLPRERDDRELSPMRSRSDDDLLGVLLDLFI
jgi:Zn-finger nucleic acid-binding protein